MSQPLARYLADMSNPDKSGYREPVSNRPLQLAEHFIAQLLHAVGGLPLYRLQDIAQSKGLDSFEIIRALLHMQATGALFYDDNTTLVTMRPLVVHVPLWRRGLDVIAALWRRHPGPLCVIAAAFVIPSSAVLFVL